MKKLFIYYSLSGNGDIIADYLKDKNYEIRKIEAKKGLPNNMFLRILTGGFLAGINHKTPIKDFDIIAPCKCFMYPQTVNPVEKEETLDTYTHFKTMHNNNLLDIVGDIIKEHYPEYSDSLKTCLTSKKSYFYNTYIFLY